MAHVLDNLRERNLIDRACGHVLGYSFTAALVLMINAYGANKMPELSDSATSDVYKCIGALEAIVPLCVDDLVDSADVAGSKRRLA